MSNIVQLRWDTWSDICDLVGVGKLSDGKPEGCYLDDKGHPTSDTTDTIGLLIPTDEGLDIAREMDIVIRDSPTGDIRILRDSRREE